MELRKIRDGILEWFNSTLENPILTSFLVLVILTVLILFLSVPYYLKDFYSYYGQVLIEAHGMLFDLLIIGILIFWLNKNGEKRQRIRTYRDEIDDFRLWESEEAAFRTVGNIKRLNRHGINKINLVECFLARTNLNYANLVGSNLNSANISNSFLIETDLRNARLNQTNFENSNLNQAVMSDAYASGANFKNSFLIKSDFHKAFLIKTSFKNAMLMEANLQGCYLEGTDFENANLYKADLRKANGLTVEQLTKAKSLYQTKFDQDILSEIQLQHPELINK
ncbi:MAG: pentapeptide repeat-containing protein [Bacteroidetes bacterium]|nr:pentapeptide repeat-containing protein [Bacteroidota bacterium]